MKFKDKKVIITGASSGLGRALALAFAKEGAFVGIGYNKSKKEAEQSLAEVLQSGGAGTLIHADVKDYPKVEEAIKKFLKEHSQIDILINNAAIVEDKPLALMSAENWSSVIDTNLNGVFNCSRAVIRSMISKRAGVIINIGSVSGIRSSPGQANYSASKGGVHSFTQSIASELATYGIRVNAVVPGILAGGMAVRLDSRIAAAYKERIPISRFGELNEICSPVLYLASNESSYIVGQTLVVDGGLTL